MQGASFQHACHYGLTFAFDSVMEADSTKVIVFVMYEKSTSTHAFLIS